VSKIFDLFLVAGRRFKKINKYVMKKAGCGRGIHIFFYSTETWPLPQTLRQRHVCWLNEPTRFACLAGTQNCIMYRGRNEAVKALSPCKERAVPQGLCHCAGMRGQLWPLSTIVPFPGLWCWGGKLCRP